MRATVLSTGSCGTATPSEPQKSRVQAPAAQMTAFAATAPCSVTTPDTHPAEVSMPRTAARLTMLAPARTAPRAIAGAARPGSARASLAVKSAPGHRPSAASTSSSSALQ